MAFYDYESNNPFTRGFGSRNEPARRSLGSNSSQIETLRDSLVGQHAEVLAEYNPSYSYTSVFNTWVTASGYGKTSRKQTHESAVRGIQRFWIVRETITWPTSSGSVSVFGMGKSGSLKDAINEAQYGCLHMVARGHFTMTTEPAILKDCEQKSGKVVVQMDSGDGKEDVGGIVDQMSVKIGNTIVTRDQGETSVSHEPRSNVLVKLASSEPLHDFGSLTDRFIPLDVIPITTDMKVGTLVSTLSLPLDMLSKTTIPALAAFNQFVYGNYDFEIKFVVNANKLHCGKVCVSVLSNPYQHAACFSNHQSAVMRDHILLDLSSNTEGTIKIPYSYHRAQTRNAYGNGMSVSMMTSVCVGVFVHIYSQMMTGPGGLTSLDIRPFVRVTRAGFAGMSEMTANAQMDTASEFIESAIPVHALKSVIKGVEATLDQVSKSRNQDKPSYQETTIVVPRPRLHFTSGKGLADVSVLGMSPYALTSFGPICARDNDPKTVLDIARVWGVWKSFKWSATDKHDTELLTAQVDPCLRYYTKDFTDTPTPLEFVTGMFQLWSGTIELRFDFVSNTFHTGSVMISVEFERTGSLMLSMSSYTKTVHLGDQKSFTMVVPFISDTAMKRTSGMVYNPLCLTGTATSDQVKGHSLTLRSETGVRVKMRVINELVPIAAAPQEINVLVFMRGGKDYALHGLKQSSYVVAANSPATLQFPLDYLRELKPSNFKVVTGTPNATQTKIMKQLSGFTKPNRWMVKKPTSKTYAQMDTGDKETEHVTKNFGAGMSNLSFMSADMQCDILDILRKPCLVVEEFKVTKRPSMFLLPIRLVSSDWGAIVNNVMTPAEYTPSMCATPQYNLGSCFRMWRGHMRYVIIVHTDTTNPIYITYFPHSGSQLHGNSLVNSSVETHTPYGTGAFVEMIITSINRTCHIEVPYTSENYWTLIGCEDGNRNFPWRDKGDYNAGHIAISCKDEIVVSIWQSLGDAGEVSDFRGVPYSNSSDWAYCWSDDAPKVSLVDVVTTAAGQATVQVDSGTFKIKEPHLIDIAKRVQSAVDDWQAMSEDDEDYYAQTMLLNLRIKRYINDLQISGYTVNMSRIDESSVVNIVLTTVDQLHHQGFWFEGVLDTSYTASGKAYVQMEEAVELVTNILKPKNLTRAAIASVPIVGPGLLLGHVADEINGQCDLVRQSINRTMESAERSCDELNVAGRVFAYETTKISHNLGNTTQKIDEMAAKISSLADIASVNIDKVGSLINNVVEGIIGSFSALVSYGSILVDTLIDLAHAWFHKSWAIVGTSFIKILMKVVPSSVGVKLFEYASQLGQWISDLFTPRVVAEFERDNVRLCGIFAGIVGTILGVSFDPRRVQSIPASLFHRLTQSTGITYLNAMIRFVDLSLKTVCNAVLEWCGIYDVNVHAMRMLQGKSKVLEKFIVDGQMLTMEANTQMFSSNNYRTKFWFTVMQAYQIQKLLIMVPDSKASPQLAKLCSEVIKVGQERFVDVSGSPVRFEPFVFCIEGPSGIGKSYACEDMVKSMLGAIGYNRPTAGYIYTRMPGSKFWSGYSNQPCILYDDWMNLNTPEAVETQIAEFYGIKTTAMWRPEMAHIDEKRITGNPILLGLMTNDAFPRSSLNGVANHVGAIYRRRNIVIRAELKPEYVGMEVRSLPREVTENYGHLQYQLYGRSPNESGNYELMSRVYDYESVMEQLVEQFKFYHAIEIQNVDKRVQTLKECLYGAENNMLDIEDPFRLFYAASTDAAYVNDPEQKWLPSDQLNFEVERLIKLVDDHQNRPMAQVDGIGETVGHFCGVGGPVIKGFIKGFISQSGFIERVLHYVKQGLVFSTTGNDAVGEIQLCCICMNENRARWSCKSTYERFYAENRPEEAHYVCFGCSDSLIEHNRAHSCPVCRSEIIDATRLEDTTVLQKIVAVAKMYGVKSVYYVEFVRSIFASHNSIQGRVMDSLWGLMSLWKTNFQTIFGSRVDAYSATLDCSFFFGRMSANAFFQMEGEDAGFAARIHDIGFANTREQVSRRGPCLHGFLRVHGSLGYSDDGWRQVMAGSDVGVHVPDAVCGNDCAWLDERVQRQFYTEYGHLRGRDISRNIVAVINDSTNGTYFRSRIPMAFRPDWMHDLNLREEVRNLGEVSWIDSLSGLVEKYKVLLCIGGAVAAIAAVCYGGKRMYDAWFVQAQNGPGPYQYKDKDDFARSGKKVVNRRPVKHFVRAQNENPSVEEVVPDKVAANFVTVRVELANGQSRRASVCGLQGHIALLPKHYLRLFSSPGSVMYLSSTMNRGGETRYTYCKSDFVESDNTDLAIWHMPRSYPLFKDILKYFATDDDLTNPTDSVAQILVPPTKRDPELFIRDLECVSFSPSEVIYYEDKGDGPPCFEANDIMMYDFSCPGACGAIIMKKRGQRPIYGMHVAGLSVDGPTSGRGVILTREAIEEALIPRVTVEMEDVELGELEESNMHFPPEVNIVALGTLRKEQVPFIPKKTKIRKSLIHGKIGHEPATDVCILDKHDKRWLHDKTPLWYGVAKHGKLTTDFKSSVVERCKNALWEGWYAGLEPLRKARRFTPEEACVGIPGDQRYYHIILSSSAGWPYNTTQNKQKQDYVSFEVDKDLMPVKATIEGEVLEELKRKEELRRKGVMPLTLFIDTLKDERKLKEKVIKPGGTRVFCNGPIDYVISIRQNFLDFTAAFIERRHRLMHGVGITPNSPEWTSLAIRLLKHGANNIVTLDYSNFGPGFNSCVARAAGDIMVRWVLENVEGTDEQELNVLLDECIHSTHLCGNLVYQQRAGSPSGAAFTTEINSIVNQLYVFIAWSELIGGFCMWEKFKANVELCVYGDDLIMSVSDEYIDRFNGQTITSFFADYGITATGASKQGDTPKCLPLWQSVFLKHGFGNHETRPHIYQAKFVEETLYDVCQWIHECCDHKEATRENVISMMWLAHGHGKKFFNRLLTDVNAALRRARISPVVISWEEIDNEAYEDKI